MHFNKYCNSNSIHPSRKFNLYLYSKWSYSYRIVDFSKPSISNSRRTKVVHCNEYDTIPMQDDMKNMSM